MSNSPMVDLFQGQLDEAARKLEWDLACDIYGPPVQGPKPVPGWPGWHEPPRPPWWRRAWEAVVRFRWRVFPYYLRHIDEDAEDDE